MFRVLKAKIPLDGNTHQIVVTGPVLTARLQDLDHMSVWYEDRGTETRLEMVAVPTGPKLVPDSMAWVGTDMMRGLVVHLYGRSLT